MKAITVDRPVEITGKDFFGRDACLRITPTDKSGWWWKAGEQIDGSDVLIPIMPEMIKTKFRRICFRYNRKTLLNFVEHITVFRMMGLDCIVLESKTPWAPYLTSREMLNLLSFKLLDYNLETQQLFSNEIPIVGNRYSAVLPVNNDEIKLYLVIDYSNTGKKQKTFVIKNKEDVVNIIMEGSRSPALPSRLYLPAILVTEWFGWPHFHRFLWLQHLDKENALRCFVNHRALDVLGAIGAMSLNKNQKMIVPSFTSFRGGHKLDILALRKVLNL